MNRIYLFSLALLASTGAATVNAANVHTIICEADAGYEPKVYLWGGATGSPAWEGAGNHHQMNRIGNTNYYVYSQPADFDGFKFTKDGGNYSGDYRPSNEFGVYEAKNGSTTVKATGGACLHGNWTNDQWVDLGLTYRNGTTVWFTENQIMKESGEVEFGLRIFHNGRQQDGDGYWWIFNGDFNSNGSTGSLNVSPAQNQNSKVTLPKGTEYRLELDASTMTMTLVIEKEPEPQYKNFYFYGDMNRWSALKGTSESGEYNYAGNNITISDDSGNDITDRVWPGDKPKYCTADELESVWKFQPVKDNSTLPENIKTVAGTWYVLDFTNITDANGDARLCGQFKITEGVFNNENNFGINFDKDYQDQTANYYNNTKISGNSLFEGGVKNSGLKNFQLNASYMENAKLYFNPGEDQKEKKCYIYIDVPEKDIHRIYAYYGVVGSNDYAQPQSQFLNCPSQVNYYVNDNGFNGSDSESIWNVKDENGKLTYAWEKYYGEDGNGVEYNGIKFPYVYRRMIPEGATHRFPVVLNMTIKGRNGGEFPTQQIDCDDIWFVEGEVNVWFRYEDPTRNPNQVGLKVFKKIYDPNLLYEIDQEYYHSNWEVMDKDQESTLYPGVKWFKSKEAIDYLWASGTYALFRTSEGANFPVGGVKAMEADLNEAYINGADLYYVVPNPDPEIHILYTHLNGSYQLGTEQAAHSFQIQAEFFDPTVEDGELDTRYNNDNIRYAFEVRDTNGDLIASTEYSNKPYFEGWQPSNAGFYNVIVKVKVDGREYSASDIYVVYPYPAK